MAIDKIKKVIVDTIMRRLREKWNNEELENYDKNFDQTLEEKVEDVVPDIEVSIEDIYNDLENEIETFFDEQKELYETEMEFNDGDYEDYDDSDTFKGLCEY